jgi:hypothetical protein
MTNPRSIRGCLVAAALCLCACIGIAQTSSNKRIDDRVLRDAAKNGEEWVS